MLNFGGVVSTSKTDETWKGLLETLRVILHASQAFTLGFFAPHPFSALDQQVYTGLDGVGIPYNFVEQKFSKNEDSCWRNQIH